MKKISMMIVMTVVLHDLGLAQQNKISLASFTWLIGTWENMDMEPGETAAETWSRGEAGSLLGLGCTLRGNDTVFIEKLKIVKKDGDWYYVADVSHNAAPVFFKMTSVNASGFVCENPEHDFPQKISYRLDGDIISAAISAGPKEIPFRFRRKK